MKMIKPKLIINNQGISFQLWDYMPVWWITLFWRTYPDQKFHLHIRWSGERR